MIILFGPAGSGKSTQGQELAQKLGWKWLSVGQVLRDSGEFGGTLQQGELVDDEKVVKLMHEKMMKVRGGGVLDGYPRDVRQAEWIAEHDLERIDGAIVLDVPVEELWRRLRERGRADDTEEAVSRRFEIFEQNIYAILKVLEDNDVKITTVNGDGTVEEVNRRLVEAVEEMMTRDKGDMYDEERSYGE
jgi:adenylate kinase